MADEQEEHIEKIKIEHNALKVWDIDLRSDLGRYKTDASIANEIARLDNNINSAKSDLNRTINSAKSDLNSTINSTKSSLNNSIGAVSGRVSTLESKNHTVLYVSNKNGNIWTLSEVNING